jgi:hypothetical protein
MSPDLYCSGLYWAVDVCEVTVMQPEREAELRAGVRFHHCIIYNIAYDSNLSGQSTCRANAKHRIFLFLNAGQWGSLAGGLKHGAVYSNASDATRDVQ